MKKFQKLLIAALILIFICYSMIPASATNKNQINPKLNYKPQDESPLSKINFNKIYLMAQVSGKIRISDTCSFFKSPISNTYYNIVMNGTVTNSTLFDPFCIWPLISIIPGLRNLYLPNNASIYIDITRLNGEIYTQDDGETYRIRGNALIVIASATVDLHKIKLPRSRF